MGAGKRNFRELDQAIQLKTNGLNVSFHASEHPSNQNEFENVSMQSFNMLTLFSDIITKYCNIKHCVFKNTKPNCCFLILM